MATYNRSARISGAKAPSMNQAQDPQEAPEPKDAKKEKMVRINGYQQVLEMLQVADPAFRKSLLHRISLVNPKLAGDLRRELGN